MPPDLHRFTPTGARIYVRSEDGRQVELNLAHVQEIHFDRGADHDYMANAFRYFDAAAEQVGITLKGLQLAIKLSTPDGEEKDVSYEDWERMILNGIHNEDK